MNRSIVQLNRLRRSELESITAAKTPRQLPILREECEGGLRPCPFLSCRYHLAADISKAGNIQFSFMSELLEEGDNWDANGETKETCALDVAARGPAPLDQIAAILGITRERVRQIEAKAQEALNGEDNEVSVEGGLMYSLE